MADVRSIGCSFGGKSVVIPTPGDPRFAYALEKGANSYTCPIGREPGRGFLCMERQDLDDLDFDVVQELKWTGNVATGGNVLANGTFTIKNLYVVNDPIRLDASGDDNPNSLYLVEISDVRWLLSKFSSINKAYNLRKPGNNFGNTNGLIAARFYSDTLNAGSLW